MYAVQRTEEEINNVLNLAAQEMDKGSRQSNYYEGVSDALRWLFGESDSNPVADVEDESEA